MQQVEPVSPELVLVDPELALRARARLAATPLDLVSVPSHAPPPNLRVAGELPQAPSRFRVHEGLLAGVLGLSLFLNGYLAAGRLDRPAPLVGAAAPAPAPSPAPQADPRAVPSASGAAQTQTAEPAPAAAPTAQPSAPRREASAAPTRIEVERRVLASVVDAPAAELPPDLLDEATGLPKNNLQAVCSRMSTTSFLCVVQPAGRPVGEGVYVRYTRAESGREALTWRPFRPSTASSQG